MGDRAPTYQVGVQGPFAIAKYTFFKGRSEVKS